MVIVSFIPLKIQSWSNDQVDTEVMSVEEHAYITAGCFRRMDYDPRRHVSTPPQVSRLREAAGRRIQDLSLQNQRSTMSYATHVIASIL